MLTRQIEKMTVIGAGPAGIATAIQLERYGLAPIILEKNEVGGLLRNANLVENYPGFPGGISGLDLVNLFKKQLEEKTIKLFFEEVTKLDYEDQMFLTRTQKRTFYSQIVVIASGTKPRKFSALEIPEEVRDKILYEIYPILGAKGKRIVIVGAGDASFDYALNLEKANQVVILNRKETAKCFPLLWEKAKRSPRIMYCKNAVISKIMPSSDGRIFLEYQCPEGISKLSADYLIFSIGRESQLDFLSKRLKDNLHELENMGFLYLVGDVKNETFRQAVIAMGDGVRTGMRIYEKMKEIQL